MISLQSHLISPSSPRTSASKQNKCILPSFWPLPGLSTTLYPWAAEGRSERGETSEGYMGECYSQPSSLYQKTNRLPGVNLGIWDALMKRTQLISKQSSIVVVLENILPYMSHLHQHCLENIQYNNLMRTVSRFEPRTTSATTVCAVLELN